MGVSRGPDFKPVENMLVEGASFSQQSDLHLCKIIFQSFKIIFQSFKINISSL